MNDATQPHAGGRIWREHAFDLTRGIAAYTATVRWSRRWRASIASHPEADLDIAFNHKQVACKMWARDELFEPSAAGFDAHLDPRRLVWRARRHAVR